MRRTPKNRRISTEVRRFYFLLLHYSLFTNLRVDFWKVRSNSEEVFLQGFILHFLFYNNIIISTNQSPGGFISMKKTLKTKISGTICLVLGIAFAIVGLYYYHMQYLCYEYTPLQFILGLVVCIGGALLSIPLKKESGKNKTVVKAVLTAMIFFFFFMGLMFLINAIIGSGELELAALDIPVYITFIITFVMALLCALKIFNSKIIKAVLSLLIIAGFLLGSHSYIKSHIYVLLYEKYTAPTPVISKISKEKNDDKMIMGDFYVSTTGNDNNSGTKDSPFLTIEKAVEAVRNADKAGKKGITVCIEGGEYRVSSLELTKEDSGTEE